MQRTKRAVACLILFLCLLSVRAGLVANVALSPAQVYSFYMLGAETQAWVCHSDFGAATQEWYGPYVDTPIFTLTLTHTFDVWYGIYTYDANVGEYERAYYYYNQIL